MKRLTSLLIAALVVAGLVAGQALAAGVNVSQAGGAKFPEREFIVTLTSKGVVRPNQISITEGGARVPGVSVEPASAIGQSHFGTVLVVDTSDSMAGAAEQSAIQAMRTFVQSRNPHQPVGIVFFDQTPRVVVPMTTNNATLEHALATVPQLHSGTHLYDAVGAALKMLASANLTGGSIIVASDGRDTGSTVSQQAVASQAASQGTRFYTVGVRDPSFDGTTLQSLAAATGGTYAPVASSSLPTLYHDLGLALSNQYLVRYESRSTLGSKVAVVVHVAGHGSASTNYSTPSLAPAVASGPSGVAQSSSFWTSTTAAVLICLICAMLIGLAILALTTQRAGVRDRIGPFVGVSAAQPVEDKPRSLVQRALGDPRGRRASRTGWAAVLAEELEVARLQISFSRLILLTVVATIAAFYVLLSLEGVLAGMLALLVPFGVRIGIRMRANRQRRTFDEQLPDNLGVVASALRAGNTFAGSLGVVANDAPEPSRRELRRALSDEQLGVPLVDALNRISDRMRSTDFHHVALVATLQAETGGNTAEVLDVVTETIRDRIDLRRMVRTLTAQGRLAGMILSGMPVMLLIILSIVNPHYTSPLFHETAGIIALVIAGVLVITGSVVIRKIVNIDV
ncbi:MAG: VWA domain-containing protein [Solirubrobacteraceae bacterium]